MSRLWIPAGVLALCITASADEIPATVSSPPAVLGTSETDLRLLLADERLRQGTRLWSQGEGDEARLKFDQAVRQLITVPASLPGRERLLEKYDSVIEAIYRMEADSNSGAEPVYEEAPLDAVLELTFATDPKLKGKIRDQVLATASQLPLELTDPVVWYIQYFSSPRGRKKLLQGLGRMRRYEPMIRRILDEEGVPRELIHLAQAESSFIPRAVSRAKAGGIWQFMRTRGREYGLKQSKYHDDRFDPEKSTRAAARHLRDLYEQFGDWYLAIAAYNGGPGRVAQAVEHTGYADFWELYARGGLRRETANYLPIILAMTIMSKNARAYDLDDVQAEQPEAHDSVDLPSLTHLALVADITGRPLAEIRDLNPSVLNFLAPQGHQIHVPKGTAGMVAAALSAIPAERLASWRLHRVASEETLSALAQQYRTTEAKISEANRSAPEDLDLREGDLVIIPVSYPAKPDVLSNRRS